MDFSSGQLPTATSSDSGDFEYEEFKGAYLNDFILLNYGGVSYTINNNELILGNENTHGVYNKYSSCENYGVPVGENNQNLQAGQTLAELVVEGENLTWYSDAELTQEIPNTTLVEDGVTYYVTQSNETCTSDASAITVSTQTTGLSDEQLTNLIVYPNPALDYLTITYNNDIEKIEIIDIIGRIIRKKTVNAKQTYLNLNNLSSGIYFLTIYTLNGQGVVRFIKK